MLPRRQNFTAFQLSCIASHCVASHSVVEPACILFHQSEPSWDPSRDFYRDTCRAPLSDIRKQTVMLLVINSHGEGRTELHCVMHTSFRHSAFQVFQIAWIQRRVGHLQRIATSILNCSQASAASCLISDNADCHEMIISRALLTDMKSFVWPAVFTYGDKGIKVTAAFLVFAVTLHLAEITRLRAAKGSGAKAAPTTSSPPQPSS